MSTPQTPATSSEVRKPLTAADLANMTDQQRRELYAKYAKTAMKSKLEVRGKPGIHYLWANKTDDAEMVRLDIDGYSIVKEKDPKTPEIKAAGLRQDGTYQIGDVILMWCTEETYLLHMLEVEEKSRLLQEGAQEDFKVEQEKRGVPVFETSGRKG